MRPGPAETRGYPVEYWLDPHEVGELDYAAYWNDEEAERGKEWYVLDGDFSRMERYLEGVGLPGDLAACLDHVRSVRGRPIGGVGLDLAAGTLWAARYLLEAGPVERLYCLEYSRHRLLKLGPVVLAHYQTPPDRIVLTLGSFYDVHLADGTVDFVLMSQALHHADDPDRLLDAVARVLRPDGVAIVIGEHVVPPDTYARQAIRVAASWLLPAPVQRRLFGRRLERPATGLLPDPDRQMGDHFYSRRAYRRMFARHGFRHWRIRRRGGTYQGFVLQSGR